jgi:hypothetical protein
MKTPKVRRLFKRLVFLAGILAIAVTQSLQANPGDLDPTFGLNGTLIVPVGGTSSLEAGNAAAVQPDGKILIGGSADNDVAIFLLNADGSSDFQDGQSISRTQSMPFNTPKNA